MFDADLAGDRRRQGLGVEIAGTVEQMGGAAGMIEVDEPGVIS